jgi:hypothetical protein
VRLDTRFSMALFAFSTLAAAREAKSPSPMMTLLVYNSARAPAGKLAQAEREAGRILGEAGVRAIWLDCIDQPAADPQGLCSRAREPTDLVVRVLPGPNQIRFQDTRFGFAFLPTLASVYYDYAVRLGKSDAPIFLGCAIAHEVGHLLLGPNSHSIVGLMQGDWGPKELRLALMSGLLFTSDQSKLIRAEARRRMSLQTGTLKDERLATVDQRTEPKVIPQSD